jgi:hypothetical protein
MDSPYVVRDTNGMDVLFQDFGAELLARYIVMMRFRNSICAVWSDTPH